MSSEREWPGLNPPYATIVADPPWSYGADEQRTVRAPQNPGAWSRIERGAFPYTTMDVEAIAALPVADLAAKSCWLFLWTTNRHLPISFDVLRAWGFTYRQTLVWRKTGAPSPFGGTVAPNHAEFLLVAAMGRPATKGRLSGSVIEAPRDRSLRHSQKPPAFLDAVEQVAPGPYLELFARAPRLGWDSWGHGYEGHAA